MSDSAATVASAAQTAVIPAQAADWAESVSFAQFNPALGTLEAVAIGLTAAVDGTVWLESLEATPASVTAWFTGPVQVLAPSGAAMIVATPDALGSASVGAFTGTLETAGPSGTVLGGLADTVTAQGTYTPDAVDLAAFVGAGTVSLQAVSDITANEAGPGNLWAAFAADGAATVSLQYDYVPNGEQTEGNSNAGADVSVMIDDASLVMAGSVTTTPETITVADRTTGWTDTVSLGQFDPALGTLEAVNVTLVGNLAATVGMENLGTASGTANFGDTASVSLAVGGGAALLTASPSATDSASLPAFDGTADFAGTSGRYDTGLTGTDTETAQLTDPTNLALFTGGGSVPLQLAATGGSTGDTPADFVTELLGQAGAEVEVSYTYLPCFAAGTRLRTEHGEVAVERLRPGDRVITQDGTALPIRWIGRRSLDLTRHPRPWDVAPVRIAPHAFAPGRPHRALLLSPDHAVFVAGVLVPVRHLLNGATIRQRRPARVSYFHVELPRHDVLLAEGLPAESYLDTGNRAAFAGGRVTALHPDFARAVWRDLGCAPLVTDGAALAGLRRHLLDRAVARGFRLTDDPDLRLRVADRVLRPGRAGEALAFALPPGVQNVRLLSRSAVPAEIRVADPDRRRLGVAVAHLAADGPRPVAIVPGEGWHAAEAGWRWTDGDAALTLRGPATRLTLRLLPLLSYWAAPAGAATAREPRRSPPRLRAAATA